MPLHPATRLGPYEVLAPLGAGGMGEVWRARDTRLGRDVALKLLPADVASSPDRLARLEREARAVAALNHPNIVTLYSIEEADGTRFLTMELVEGRTLTDLVEPGGLPLARVLELAVPLAEALAAAHEKGVVHRDLKPGNVMIARDGRVKVLDFGLAKLAPAGMDLAATLAPTVAPVTGDGQVMGTIPYMAPEQIRGEPADTRSDLFALGVIVYELATGRRPFAGATLADTASAILRDAPSPLRSLRTGLPQDLERVVARCLAKNPRERAQSALDVANELRALRKAAEGGAAGRSGERVASIAVLPFVNRSASADDEYFADGLADELLSVLARIKGLRVAARTSSFHFKGKDVTIAEVGRTLGVGALLEGSVRKVGNRVRIAVQLVDVADGYHMWSDTYDRTLDDIFAVQDDIAQSVVKELRTTLLGEAADSGVHSRVQVEVSQATRGRATDPGVNQLYLQARHFLDRDTPDDIARAIGLLEEAIRREPAFALAWSLLGAAHTRESDTGLIPPAAGYGKARAAIERALAIDPDLAEGHAHLAWIRRNFDWDWTGAKAEFDRALELDPNNSIALRRAGTLAWTLGDMEAGNALHDRALEQDPLSAHAYFNLAQAYVDMGDFAQAEALARKALELAPGKAGAAATLAVALHGQGRNEEALVEIARESDPISRLWGTAIVNAAMGRIAEADAAQRELIERYADLAAYSIAEATAHRGAVDEAFAWLERAYAQRDGGLTGVKASWWLRNLHGDPRWAEFLRKMRL